MKLKHKPDVQVAKFSQRTVARRRKIHPQHPMAAGCRLHQRAQNGPQRTFARPGWPQQRRKLSRIHGQG